MELLLLKLAHSKLITPWTSRQLHKKLIDAYADDINLFIKHLHPEAQLTEILRILAEFRTLSGLKTNVLKTKYALFGNAVDSPLITATTGITIETAPFRLLGIYLNGNLDSLQLNWDKAIKAMRTEIGIWSTLKLSSTAKVNITKACLLSKFTHIATILPLPPKHTRNEIERIIVNFINGKRNKLSKKIIFTPTAYGGLGIPHLTTHWASLQCTWLKRIHLSTDIWKSLLIPSTHDPIFFLAQPPPTELDEQALPVCGPFWTEVLERWKTILNKVPTNLTIPFSNICSPSLQLRNYNYIPLTFVTDEKFNILPPSQLKERLPLANWDKISIPLISFLTASLREKCKKIATYTGNHRPLIHPLLQLTSPNIKGCKQFSKLISNDSFDDTAWSNFSKFSSTHNIPPPDCKHK